MADEKPTVACRSKHPPALSRNSQTILESNGNSIQRQGHSIRESDVHQRELIVER